MWHGKVDILLKRSIVKVSLEKDLEDLNLLDDDEEVKEKSVCKDELDDTASGDHSHSELDNYFAFVEVKNWKKKSKFQLLSQAIVNAFFTSGKHKCLRNQLIPSFCVTERYIRVVLYHVELYIILMSTTLPIWDKERSGELDAMTLIRVWLALNYSDSMDTSSKEYQTFLKYSHR